MSNIAYRPEVDGLRAVAVLSVVFFHFGFNQISGGFVGVDIFFVISGYLITKLIKTANDKGSFSFSNFYERRARRLLPAYFAVLFVSFVFAYFLFSPAHFERFSGAMFYSLFSLSNFYFWQESGYFDVESLFKPLLHTWSLGVEEQFYIIWPLLLIFLVLKPRARYSIALIIALSLASLVLSQKVLHNDASAAFYLMPFRVFEFGIGAMLVWINSENISNWVKELATLIGLSLIAYALIVFDSDTLFPGLNALIPCAGTALIIWAGQAKYSGKLLVNPVMTRIGLVSYSIYLVHWPLFVFLQYYSFDELSVFEALAAIATCYLLAEALYRGIETPCRSAERFSYGSPAKAGFVFTSIALILSFPASSAWSQSGWTWRVPAELQEIISLGDDITDEELAAWGQGECYLGARDTGHELMFPADFNVSKCFGYDDKKKNILVVGDSTAAHIVYALREKYPEFHFIQSTIAACKPIINWGGKHGCKELMNFTLKNYLPKYAQHISAVVMMGSWKGYDITFKQLDRTIERIKRRTDVDVLVVGDQPFLPTGLPSLAAKHGRISNLNNYLDSMRTKFDSTTNIEFKELLAGKADFYDFHDVLCKPTCQFLMNDEKMTPITRDGRHYTIEGAHFVAEKLREDGFLSKYL